MRLTRKAGLAIVATVALAGAAIAAEAQHVHILNIALPDGSVEHIRYTGDVAPQVVLLPAEAMPASLFAADFDAPFTALDRITAELEAQSNAMLREAALLARQPASAGGQLDNAVLAKLPVGTVSYSFVSMSGNNGVTCSQSWQVTSLGPNQKPKVVAQRSGDCGDAKAGAAGVKPASRSVPAIQTSPASEGLPKVLPVKLDAKPGSAAAAPATKS